MIQVTMKQYWWKIGPTKETRYGKDR